MIGLAPGTVCRSCFSPGTLPIYGSRKQVLALELYQPFHTVGLHLLPAVPAGSLDSGLQLIGAGYLLCAWRSDLVPTKGSWGLGDISTISHLKKPGSSGEAAVVAK